MPGLLRQWYDQILANRDDLAVLMTAEQGKPLAESKGVYGDVIPGHRADSRILVLRQPVGVVAAITP